MTLGEIVKTYREEHHLSMEEFAKLSGLSKGFISMLEKNINPNTQKEITPSIPTIQAIAKAMNVDFNVFFNSLDDNLEVSLKDTNTTPEDIKTIAAHALDDLTEEEQEEIIKYARFIKSQRSGDKK